MKYRADIDGLRSVAVIPVILFHLGFNWIDGGYYGVDVFFVISGFLITSILCKAISNDSFSMKDFWLRRVKRILPAVITVVLITMLCSFFLVYRGDLYNLTSDAIAALFSYSNFHSLSKLGDYWGASAERSFFLHGWSLSVEEQFYIFYPPFLLLLYKFKQSYLKWLVLIVTISLTVYLYGSKFHPSYTFYLLPTRAWELACGGLLAVADISKIKTRYSSFTSYLALLGFILILSSYFVFTGNDIINFHTILPVLGTVLVIAFSSEKNIIGKFLSHKTLVYVGKISYSLYLWHWPIIVLIHNYYPHTLSYWQSKALIVFLTFTLSILTYIFVENKTRKWKHTPKLVLIGLFTLVGLVVFFRSPFVEKTYDSKFNKTVYYGDTYDMRPQINRTETKERLFDVIRPERSDKYKNAFKNGGIVTSSKVGYPEIVVLGDSHGAMWAKVIDEISQSKQLKSSFYTSVGSSPFFYFSEIETLKGVIGFTSEQRIAYAKDLLENIKKWKPKLIIIPTKWNSKSDIELFKMEDLVKFSKELGVKILILNQPQQHNIIGDRNSSQFLTFLNYQPNDGYQYIKSESNVEEANEKIKKKFEAYPNVHFFDVFSRLINKNDKSESLVINGNDVLYYDDDHLSYQGTLFLKDDLEKTLTNLVSSTKE